MNILRSILLGLIFSLTLFSASASAGTRLTFDVAGTFSWLTNEGDCCAFDDLRHAVTGTLQYDVNSGTGTITINPFINAGSTTLFNGPITFQTVGDGLGGAGPLMLGNALFEWNNNSNLPVSLVWDATGFLDYVNVGVFNVTDLVTGGILPASDNTIGPGILPVGAAPFATTIWDTTPLCAPGSCIGVTPSGGLPLVTDTVVDITNGDIGIGGSPMIDGPFSGLNVNLDLTSLQLTSVSSPLPSGTGLTLGPGVGSDTNAPCASGSCMSVEVGPGFVLWYDLLPGADGGFIVGKSQASGGQELLFDDNNPNHTNLGELAGTSGEVLIGLILGHATLYTPDGALMNQFDDTSCIGAGCIGKTVLGSLNIASNGSSIPVGSAAGCVFDNCSADQVAGIFVNTYNIDLNANTWDMGYSQIVSSGPISGVNMSFIFRGDVVPPVPVPNCPVVEYAWQVPNSNFLWVFGSSLTGVTSVVIDGVNAPLVQEVDGDSLIVIMPPGVVTPWKPGTVEVTTSAGCTGKYPAPSCAL